MYELRMRSRVALGLLDALGVVASFYLAGILRWGCPGFRIAWWSLGLEPAAVILFACVVWLFTLWSHGLYSPERVWSAPKEAMTVFRAGLVMGIAVAAFLVTFKIQNVSRLFLASFHLFLIAASMSGRALLRLWMGWRKTQGRRVTQVVVVGTGPRAQEFIRRVQNNSHLGVHVVGVVRTGAEPGDEHLSVPLLGQVAELGSILRQQVIDTVVVALPFHNFDSISYAVEAAEVQGKQIHVLLDGLERRVAGSHLDIVLGYPALSVAPGAHRTFELGIKRAIDIIGAACALLITAPFALVITVLIRFDSPGSAFFRQTRVGLNGRQFTLYKFRTMVMDAEQHLQELQHLNEMNGPVFKIHDDPRITRIGRFLRKTSLDELPQFINVLRGEMSIVGPRPPLAHEVAQYESWQLRRLSVKPGLTCFWQVEGRNAIQFDEWMELDLKYIDNWSLMEDLKLIVRTIPVVFGAKGA